jgi:hypothetical protein
MEFGDFEGPCCKGLERRVEELLVRALITHLDAWNWNSSVLPCWNWNPKYGTGKIWCQSQSLQDFDRTSGTNTKGNEHFLL